MKLYGGCFYRGTRYALRAVPTSVTDCHCLDCRHSSGAAFVTWGGVLRSDFEVTQGGIREILRADRVRGFAGCCGTLLTMSDSAEDEYVEVAIASLDEPARFRPEKIIWIEDKLPWVVLDPKLPGYQRNREQKP